MLGLLSVFKDQMDASIKLASVALALGIIMGIVLYGLSVMPPSRSRQTAIMSGLMNLIFWALGFGLLCIAFSIALR